VLQQQVMGCDNPWPDASTPSCSGSSISRQAHFWSSCCDGVFSDGSVMEEYGTTGSISQQLLIKQ